MACYTAFFYGTLMAPPVLHRVIWGSQQPPTSAHASMLHIRPAILHAHRRHKVKHADYPAVVPADASTSVRGTLVEGLTDGDMWRLDIFEGDEYERRKIRAKVLVQQSEDAAHGEGGMGDVEQKEEENVEGEEIEAETYIWTAGMRRLEIDEWDFREFVKDKMGRWVGTEVEDEGFRDIDDAVAAQRDGTGGRGKNGSISRQLEMVDGPEKAVLEIAV